MSSSDSGDGDEGDEDGLAALVGSSFARRAQRPPPSLADEEAPANGGGGKKRPFAFGLHECTSEAVKGLGAQLAGSTNPVDDLWWPESHPWPTTDAAAPHKSMAVVLPAAQALCLEVMRSRRLTRLRELFQQLCAATAALRMPPINALERWRFVCKWQEDQEHEAREPCDPLLPSGPPQPADAVFAVDLQRAGLPPAAADKLVAEIRAASVDAATAVARLRAELDVAPVPSPPPAIVTEPLPGGMVLLRTSAGTADNAADEAEVSVRVTEAAVQKLRALHARHLAATAVTATAASDDAAFECRLFALLLRYEAIGGAGFQAALGGTVFRELQASLGVAFECFASPLNCYYGAFCSAFPDVDRPFGSRGSFASFAPLRGAYEANPPFVDGIIDSSAQQILAHLETAQGASEPLAFVVVLPGWADSVGYKSLLSSPLLTHSLIVAAADHGYIDGAQHTRPRSYRESTYDTRVFVLQTARHAAEHPLDAAALSRLERTLAECTPCADGPPGGGAADASQDDPSRAVERDEAARREAPACLRAHNPRKRRRRGGKGH